MSQRQKVFGVGMSKTGTTTLGACLELLGYLPHSGFEPQLKAHYHRGGDIERILKYAERFRAFEDTPWYHIYEALDERFPGSKFVLTVRKDSLTHAKSSWHHGVRRGLRLGAPTEEYLQEKIRVYEDHNRRVQEYFRERPDDLLVICWENGDGWEKLCPFLGVPIPSSPIPHCNVGRYKSRLPRAVVDSVPYRRTVRALHWVSLTAAFRRLQMMLPTRHAERAPSDPLRR